jgi:uncharacterized cupredoxin-like copper-binding protein
MKLWHPHAIFWSGIVAAALAMLVDLSGALADAGHGHDMAAGGRPGLAADVDRTVRIDATDIAFDRQTIEVRAGETIRFVVTNSGRLVHDFTLGDAATQRAHREEMAEMMAQGAASHQHPGGHGHAEANAIVLAPGETRELIWTFAEGTDFEFACNIPGHYEAGMKGRIAIAPR